MTTTMAPTRDGAREKELEELGAGETEVHWVDLDRVTITMTREGLDELIANANREPSAEDWEHLGFHADGDCNHDDCGSDGDGDAAWAAAAHELRKLVADLRSAA